MPRGDGSGPLGQGPMTGRGAGNCAGYDVPGYMNPGPGGGFWGRRHWGRGRGGGGRRHWFHATGLPGWARSGWMPAWGRAPYAPAAGAYGPIPQGEMPKGQEVESLKAQAEYFEGALEDIKKRLDELSSESE